MKRTAVLMLSMVILCGAVVAAHYGPAQAQAPQQTYTLNWWTVDGGGTTFSSGNGYTLGGSAGQPDPGVLTAGSYTLGGGFWRGGVPSAGPHYSIYLPLVTK